MPHGFNNCVKSGGKVRTKTLEGGKYVRVCVQDGKSYSGEVKEKKTTVKEAHATVPKPEPTKKKLEYEPEQIQRRPWDKQPKTLRG